MLLRIQVASACDQRPAGRLRLTSCLTSQDKVLIHMVSLGNNTSLKIWSIDHTGYTVLSTTVKLKKSKAFHCSLGAISRSIFLPNNFIHETQPWQFLQSPALTRSIYLELPLLWGQWPGACAISPDPFCHLSALLPDFPGLPTTHIFNVCGLALLSNA